MMYGPWWIVIGVLLRVLIPYAREGLEVVAESGTFALWPRFDFRYLAMALIPVLEYGVAFLTIENLWQISLGWGMIYAIALGWSGTDIGKEVIQVGAALTRIANRARK